MQKSLNWMNVPPGHRFNWVNLENDLYQGFDLQFFAPDPDKTEKPTPKRRQDARKKGQVAKSAELNSVVVLLGLFLLLNYFGEWLYTESLNYIRYTLSPLQVNQELTETALGAIMRSHMFFFARLFLPLGCGAMVIGLIVNFAQVGTLFTLEQLKPQFGRINPINGFQRLFSSRGLVELAKAVVKLTIVGSVAYTTIKSHLLVLIQSIENSPLNAALTIWDILYGLAMKICLFLLVMALFDYAYQRWDFLRNLRMSKKEVKDEYKQQEGNPQIKGKIRQRQRQIAMRRMMQAVPKADVVITNPTHFAVALQYDSKTMTAPIVIAKGENLIAAKIKEVAREHNVAIVENKPLAQALYKTVEIGEAIPAQMFQAVAEVLAFVYRLRQNHATR